MGHLYVSIWIKEHNNHTFTVWEISNFTIFDQEISYKKFGKVKCFKAPAGFERMNYKFAFKVLANCGTLLSKYF